MTVVAPEIRRSFDRVVAAYGKVGLLIDDIPRASGQVARAFYGTEALPEWWLIAHSVRCACSLLECLNGALGDGDDVLGVCIVDRYLLLGCRGRARRTVPWDGPAENIPEDHRGECERLNSLVHFLLKSKADKGGFYLELETSYPHGFWSEGDSAEVPLPWATRSLALLNRIRTKIYRNNHRDLLRFGPRRHAIVSKQAFGDKLSATEARWRVDTWWQTLEELADDLKDTSSNRAAVLLLTGAGTSLRSTPVGRGMPRTSELLMEACCRVISARHRTWKQPELTYSPPERRCACKEESSHDADETKKPWEEDSRMTPVEWMLSEVRAKKSVSGLVLRLEELFSSEFNEKNKKLFKQFRDAFRISMHRFDNLFAYHHWLLAQLPWHRVVTTNFDGFHERAAAAAASRATGSKRDRILRLGSPLPVLPYSEESLGLGKEVAQRFVRGLRSDRLLVKPYGSLLLPRKLGLGIEELKEFREHLETEFDAIASETRKRKVWIVVLGHAMEDPHLDGLIEKHFEDSKMAKSERFRFLWVIPSALGRAADARDKTGGRFRRADPLYWDKWMVSCLESDLAGPFPALAHEFAYDLWRACRRE